MKSTFAGSGAPGLLSAVKSVEARFAGLVAEPVLRVVSVDPGKITGVSVFWYTRSANRWSASAWAETLLAGDENRQVLSLAEIAEPLRSSGPVDFVIEDFRVLKISMERSFLSPVRIGQKFEWEILRSAESFYNPSAVQYVFSAEMSAMPDSRLKALGFYTPGPDHRRDATRHNLLHSRSLNNGSAKRFSTASVALKRFPGGEPFRQSPSVRRSSASAVPPKSIAVGLRKKKRRRSAI